MASIVFTSNPQNYSIVNVAQGIKQGNFQEASKALRPQSKPKARFHKQPCSSNNNTEKQDVYTRVTNKIIADLEKGNLTWTKPWKSKDFGGSASLPMRCDGQPYQGINVLTLWGTAADKGYTRPVWMTYNKANELGGQVKKGEKGTLVVYANKFEKSEVNDKGEEKISTIPFLKGYTVFNVEQIDGLPEKYYETPSRLEDTRTRMEAVEQFVVNTKVVIEHGGSRAFYSPTPDRIQMPPSQSFHDIESYYAILAHELTHWTGHSLRLNRGFSTIRFGGKSAYAMEELTAEIGSAFLCAALGITPETREDHAAYIEIWLVVLKQDNRAIFTAASQAQRAVEYLHSLNGTVVD
jgi:antirestriction protein ArdC